MKTKLKLSEWAKEDRPREKLNNKGATSLTEAELLAILIGSGNREETAVELSRRILNHAKNNLLELGRFSIHELTSNFKGIGEAKAITIVAAMELSRRRSESETIEKRQIKSSKDIFDIFHSSLSDLPYEEFWILLLNRGNKAINKIKISHGGVSGTVVDTKIILKFVLENLASSIILCHNHPSGNKNPSSEDITITQKIKKACEAIDVTLLDHIIISNNSFLSFTDEGLI